MTPEHINSSIARALKGESHLDPEVLKIHGFSTPAMRHLFSNLCNIDGLHYLEVGVYCGGTFIAAFNKNLCTAAVGIDNFAQDFSRQGVREELAANLQKWRDTGNYVHFIEGDCFELAEKPEEIGSRYDVFCYDGHHDFEPTSNALPAFFDLLADRFIFIVDDFHWPQVSAGVKTGFETLEGKVKIVQEWKLSGKRKQDDKIWWNGVFIALCEKIKDEPSFNTDLPPGEHE
jgi:hypothetical protein